MTSIPERITADRGRLATELKALRERAFPTGSAAAHAMGWSQPKMSKSENGRVLPSADDLDRLLDTYRATEQQRSRILDLAARLHSTVETNRTILRRGAAQKQTRIAEVEASAGDLRFYAPSVIPGLLQTEQYMRAMFSLDLSGDELDAAVDARLSRQRILDDDDKRLTFLISEQALRWRFTTVPTMADQIRHIMDLAHRPDVAIGILPITAAVRDVPLHGFEMFDERLVTIGLEHAVVTVTDPGDVTVYTRMFTRLADAARTGEDGQRLLATALAALPGRRGGHAAPNTPQTVEVFPSKENTPGVSAADQVGAAATPRPRREAMTTRPASAVPAAVDLTRPSVARMNDYYLGGTDTFPVDREAADRVIARVPSAAPALRANRACMERMVRFLAAQGVDQFIDLGTGLPTRGSVHSIAQQVNPAARVLYVDNDRSVLAHARAILGRDPGVTILKGDIRRPAEILDAARSRRLIDLTRPVAVLFIAILHFITDNEDAEVIVRAFRDATPPGSYLAVTAATTEDTDPAERAAIEDIYRDATAPANFRGREQIERLFAGYELVAPGLVRVPDWRPDGKPATGQEQVGRDWFYAAVGYKS